MLYSDCRVVPVHTAIRPGVLQPPAQTRFTVASPRRFFRIAINLLLLCTFARQAFQADGGCTQREIVAAMTVGADVGDAHAMMSMGAPSDGMSAVVSDAVPATQRTTRTNTDDPCDGSMPGTIAHCATMGNGLGMPASGATWPVVAVLRVAPAMRNASAPRSFLEPPSTPPPKA